MEDSYIYICIYHGALHIYMDIFSNFDTDGTAPIPRGKSCPLYD